jgi:aryl-alcohol dehydrogenase-like predicted oxidoreductase
MDMRRIGGLTVSLVGLGCNNFGRRIDASATERVVHAALDAGVTLFDTADVYGGDGASEELLGKALNRRRDEAVVATKFGMPLSVEGSGGASPRWIRQAVEDSLRRLGTDRIDLYQLHRPDPEVPIAETLGALDDLVRAGKVREIGHSNFSGEQVDEAEQVAGDRGATRFVCAQNRWSLLTRDVEDDVVPAVERHGLAVLPYFPLEAGVLTGKYTDAEAPDPAWRLAQMPEESRRRFLDDERLDVVRDLTAFARDRGHTLLELAISWLASQPVVASVIAGATKPDQVRANAGATGWRLTADERAEVDRLTGRG